MQNNILALLVDSSNSEFVLGLAKSISDYGALIVIAAVYLGITFFTMRRIMNSYSNTIDGIIPELSKVTESIIELQKTFNEVMSAHNAHTNQSLRTLERDSKDTHSTLLECQKSLKEIEGEVNILRSNYETLFRIMLSNNNNRTGFVNRQEDYGNIYVSPNAINRDNNPETTERTYVEFDD